MRRRAGPWPAGLGAAASIGYLLLVPAPAQGSLSVRLAAFREAHLTASEIAAVERGDGVAKMIDTDDRSEVLSAAALRVKATPEVVLGWMRGLDDGRRQPWVLQSGRLGQAPSTGDLDTLTLEASDVRDLARCRVRDCEVRLPREAIEQFHTYVPWWSPAAAPEANRLMREILVNYAAAYLRAGDAALFEYVNNDDTVHIATAFHRILLRSSFLQETAPDVAAYLSSYPGRRPPDVEDFISWMKEKFWRTSVVSLNHCVIADRHPPGGRLIIAATKQLYATHYYEASLTTTIFTQEVTESYVVTINRTRADIRPSGFTWIERLLLNRLVRHRLEAQVRVLQRVLEGGQGDAK